MSDTHNARDLSPSDDGLLLYTDERELLEAARAGDGGRHLFAKPSQEAHLVGALEALGRLRAGKLTRAINEADLQPPMNELRGRIRRGIDSETERLLLDDTPVELRVTHAIKDLACSYVALGGDLETSATVPANEYAQLAAELEQANQDKAAAAAIIDSLVTATEGLSADDFPPGSRLEDLGQALLGLNEVGR